jgi:hypothetical protein
MKALNSFWTRRKGNEYQVIPPRELLNTSYDVVPPQTLLWFSAKALLVVLLCVSSFFAGQTLSRMQINDLSHAEVNGKINLGSLEPPGSIVKSFEFNTIYSESPSKESNKAWTDELPR